MKTKTKLAGAEMFGYVVVVDPSISEEIKFKKKLEEAKKAGPFFQKKVKSQDKNHG